jgi:hypothetical protein
MQLGLRDFGKVCREVFQGLSRAGINAHLEQSVTILVRRALNRHRQFRFLPILGEDERPNRLGTGWKHPYGEDELFWRDDFSIDARERVSLTTIGSAMDPTKDSVRPQVDFANGERHAARVPPMCDVFGISPCFENNGARRIEDARYHDFAVGGSCDFYCPDVLHW